MDDDNQELIHFAKHAYIELFIDEICPEIIKGLKTIFDEAVELCKSTKEHNKYLLTFQNLLETIPKWNTTIIDNEVKRIKENCKCTYLDNLLSAAHVMEVKILTSVRVGNKQKKIDINIPSLRDFIHKLYIHCGRNIYKKVYLYNLDCVSLERQKNNATVERIIRDCIIKTIHDGINVAQIIKSQFEETVEEDIVEEIKEEITPVPSTPTQTFLGGTSPAPLTTLNTVPIASESLPSMEEVIIPDIARNDNNIMELIDSIPEQSITFNTHDEVIDISGEKEMVHAPKDVSFLAEKEKEKEKDNDFNNMVASMDEDKITISDTVIDLGDIETF